MADEGEFDIYSDYDFGQADDILDEIVNDNPTPKKRPRPTTKEPSSEPSPKTPKIEKEVPQRIQTTTQTYQPNSTDTKSLPYSITQLRGITTKPAPSIYLGELHWYTTDKDVKAPLEKANLITELKEMTFFEHKINGKSKGIVFFEFNSKDAAMQAKSIFEKVQVATT
ncbi:hypothetical protein EDC96DRAFT_503098 [Choanephora cucurbitarum]|nr:hypothetical protein EDC96DRAFT_503098 [Choanephora cucurbitarum]